MKFYDEVRQGIVDVTPEAGEAVVIRGDIPRAKITADLRKPKEFFVEAQVRFDDKDAFKAAVEAAGGIPKWDAMNKAWRAYPAGQTAEAMLAVVQIVTPFVVWDERAPLPVPAVVIGTQPLGQPYADRPRVYAREPNCSVEQFVEFAQTRMK